jgi:hypothetical protein
MLRLNATFLLPLVVTGLGLGLGLGSADQGLALGLRGAEVDFREVHQFALFRRPEFDNSFEV